MAKSKKPKSIDLENDNFSPKITKAKATKTISPSPQSNISPDEVTLPDPVTFAMEALVDGNTEMRVTALLKKHYPSITNDAYCSQILTKARKTFAGRDKEDKNYYRNKYKDMYLSLYTLAKKAGHYKTCSDIIDNLCKIEQIYEPDKRDHFIANITYSQFDPKTDKKDK